MVQSYMHKNTMRTLRKVYDKLRKGKGPNIPDIPSTPRELFDSVRGALQSEDTKDGKRKADQLRKVK